MILVQDQEIWTEQPQYPVGIRDDLAGHLTYGFVGGQKIALQPATPLSNSFVPDVSAAGQLWSNNTTQITLNTVADSIMPIGSEVTILFHGRVTSGIGALIGNDRTNSADFNIFLPYTNGSVYFRWGGEVEGATALVTAGLTFSNTDSFAFTCGPRGMELWQNGRKMNSNSATPSRTADATAVFYLGTQSNGGGISLVKSSLFTIFKNQLPQSVLAQRYYWDIFAPEEDYLFPADGGAVIGGASGRVGLIGAATGQKIATAQTTGAVRASGAAVAAKIAAGSATGQLRPGASTVASKIVPASTVGLIALRGAVAGTQTGAVIGGASGRIGLISATAGQKIATAQTAGTLHTRGASAASKIATGSAVALLRPGASAVASKIIPASTVGLIALRGSVVGAQISAGAVAPSAERTLLIAAETRLLQVAAEWRNLTI